MKKQTDSPSMEILNNPSLSPIREVFSLFLESSPSAISSLADINISVLASASVRNSNTNLVLPGEASIPTSSASGTTFSREILMMSKNKTPQSKDKKEVYKRMKEK
nr:uncharacterized protein LOC113807894 [Penaeus vannamei]